MKSDYSIKPWPNHEKTKWPCSTEPVVVSHVSGEDDKTYTKSRLWNVQLIE